MSTAAPGLNDATRAVRALEADFQRHANAGDANALSEGFYTEDAVLLPPNAPQQNGRAAIRDFWKAFLATGISEVVLETGEVTSSGDLAYGVGQYGYAAGGARQTGKYIVVYCRQSNGSYRAVADSFGSNA